IEHNTALQTGNILMVEGPPAEQFVFQNNIALHNAYGLAGAGTAPGRRTLEAFFPGAVFRKNVIVGGEPGQHPSDNFFPRSLDRVGFADAPGRDYRLAERCPYRRAATDGTDVGADAGRLQELARSLESAAPERRARP